MKISPQVIYKDNEPEFVVLPFAQYQDILEQLEDLLEDIEVQKRLAGDGENFPGELVFAICEGKNPVKAYREYRKLSQVELAEKVKVTKQYISQLETGERKGSIKVLRAIAKALSVDLDDLTMNQD